MTNKAPAVGRKALSQVAAAYLKHGTETRFTEDLAWSSFF